MTVSVIVDAETLADAIAPVSTLVSECKIHVEDDGLEIAAVDPANVAMVDMTLDASACAHYRADGTTLGVNLERLEDVLGMADSDDMVQFDLNEESRKLDIVIGGLEYTLALIDPDSIRQEPDIPELELPATVVCEGGEISRALTAADLVSDHVQMGARPDGEMVIGAEGDTDNVETTLGDDDLLSAAVSDDVESLFSLDYLSAIEGPIDTDTDVSLLLGEEMPVKLRYSIGDATEVVHMVAPRIQSEG